MSLCPMSPRSLRRLNRSVGAEFIHAAAHHNGRDVLVVDVDGEAWWVDRRTGEKELEPAGSTFARRYKEARHEA